MDFTPAQVYGPKHFAGPHIKWQTASGDKVLEAKHVCQKENSQTRSMTVGARHSSY
jgi:hypothetical protein